VGGQDLVYQPPGAFTGGVSAAQLAELKAACCIIGHSERREHFGDSDAIVAAKLETALGAGLRPVLCFGESESLRLEGRTENFVRSQIEAALGALPAAQLGSLVLAYEPIWAIGTGKNAEAADAQAVHQQVRGILRERFGEALAATIPILYGGSVKPGNIASYLACADIDGALVGGASLDADSFLQLAAAG
jgi:triosephosphate isomerase